MKINRNELIEKLEFVLPAVGRGSFVLDHQNFHFDGDILFSTDGQTSIFTQNPIPEESFSIKADSFLNLLRNTSSDEVTLEMKDSNLIVRTTKIQGKFRIEKSREAEIPEAKEAKDLRLCPTLIEGLRLCRFGICKEKTSGSIGGVRVEGAKVYSTDRFRIHKYNLGISSGVDPFTVPSKFIDIMCKNRDKIQKYGLSGNLFYVLLEDGSIIQSSIYLDDFPKLEEYFNQLNLEEFSDVVFTSDLGEVLERHLKSFLGGVDFFDKETRFEISKSSCTLYSESKGSGNLVETIELESDIGEHKFVVNPSLVQEVLQYGKGKFLYHPTEKIILLDSENLQVLIQTKV